MQRVKLGKGTLKETPSHNKVFDGKKLLQMRRRLWNNTNKHFYKFELFYLLGTCNILGLRTSWKFAIF
jgi:hypothetical protein